MGAGEFFWLVRRLLERGQIELLNSPMYHPVIPLSPVGLVVRQLDANRNIVRELLGQDAGGGVYPPELAIDEKSLAVLGESKYVIVDESAVNPGVDLGRIWDRPVVHFAGRKLLVNSRSVCEVLRSYPTRLNPQELTRFVLTNVPEGETVVSVNDAEIFGHHYEERWEVLDGMWGGGEFEFVTGTQASDDAKPVGVDRIATSSWQTMLAPGEDPLGIWRGEKNEFQRRYLELGMLAHGVYQEFEDGVEVHAAESARNHLDRGWSSCHLYWLSNKPWWHPDMASKGAEQLIKCVRTMPASIPVKQRAEEIYYDLLKNVWKHHWSGRVEKGYMEYEEKRKGFLQALPKL